MKKTETLSHVIRDPQGPSPDPAADESQWSELQIPALRFEPVPLQTDGGGTLTSVIPAGAFPPQVKLHYKYFRFILQHPLLLGTGLPLILLRYEKMWSSQAALRVVHLTENRCNDDAGEELAPSCGQTTNCTFIRLNSQVLRDMRSKCSL